MAICKFSFEIIFLILIKMSPPNLVKIIIGTAVFDVRTYPHRVATLNAKTAFVVFMPKKRVVWSFQTFWNK